MKLSSESRTVRWAYWLDLGGPPSRTSLCAIFWRCVLITPARIALPIALVCLLVGLGGVVFYQLWQITRVPFVLVGVAIALWLIVHLVVSRWTPRAATDGRPPLAERIGAHPLTQGALAVKRRVCPLVEID